MAEVIATSIAINWDKMATEKDTTTRLAILNKEPLVVEHIVGNLEAQLPLESRMLLERGGRFSEVGSPEVPSPHPVMNLHDLDAGSTLDQNNREDDIIHANAVHIHNRVEAGTSYSFLSILPKAQSSMYVQGKKAAQNGGLAFRLCHKKPNWFIRFWHKIFFGFEWEDYHE